MATAALIIPLSQTAFRPYDDWRSAAAAGPSPPSCWYTEPGPTASWDAVTERLQRDGYTVYAPPNPLPA